MAINHSCPIHPCSLLSEWRCLIMAAENPGTPATVSRKMTRVSTARSSSVFRLLWMV